MNYYSAYLTKMKELAELAGISSLLSWDQEIYLPQKSGDFRAHQLALINGLMHEKATDSSLLSAIENSILHKDTGDFQKLNLVIILITYYH